MLHAVQARHHWAYVPPQTGCRGLQYWIYRHFRRHKTYTNSYNPQKLFNRYIFNYIASWATTVQKTLMTMSSRFFYAKPRGVYAACFMNNCPHLDDNI